MSAANDRVRVTTRVDVTPAIAFEIFTREIDSWWRRGPRFRFGRGKSGGGVLMFANGRLLERFDDGTAQDVGRVLVWDEGARLVFEWRLSSFAPDECTEVEVRFAPGSDGASTEVTLEHRGWSAIRQDHPARHGESDGQFTITRAMWWNEIVASYRRFADEQRPRDTRGD